MISIRLLALSAQDLAKNNETLQLLDGNTIKLNKNTIVVSDESGSIGLAGIMGGNSTSAF